MVGTPLQNRRLFPRLGGCGVWMANLGVSVDEEALRTSGLWDCGMPSCIYALMAMAI